MAKNSEKFEKTGTGGGGGRHSTIMTVLKFVFFIMLLPFVVTSTAAFIRQLNALPPDLVDFFVRGILIYLLIHVFIYEPQGVYQYGQNMVSAVFRFLSPLVKVAPFFLPIYSILFLILFYFVTLIFQSAALGHYFMFLVSFTLTMHMVFTAKALRDKDSNAVKPHYFFGISIIYSVNIFILALMFDLILTGFSFPNYFNQSTSATAGVYSAIFQQLFVVR